MTELVRHTFKPVFDANSRILIVGSMASALSRKNGFYYGNPHNRFWKLMARLFGENEPQTIVEKRTLLLSRGVALYDVLETCEIEGSADASIANARPHDFSALFAGADIRRVFANGGAACRYYKKFIGPHVTCLPSTSPANAAWGMDRLADAWGVILEERG